MARMEVALLAIDEVTGDRFAEAVDHNRTMIDLTQGFASTHYAWVHLSNGQDLRLTVKDGLVLGYLNPSNRVSDRDSILVRPEPTQDTRLTPVSFAHREDGQWHTVSHQLVVGDRLMPWSISDFTGRLAAPSLSSVEDQDHVPTIESIIISTDGFMSVGDE